MILVHYSLLELLPILSTLLILKVDKDEDDEDELPASLIDPLLDSNGPNKEPYIGIKV
jgi:hypothetical protein